MPSKLKIAYIPTESSGVNFYRAFQPAEALRKMGVEVALLWYSHRDVFRHSWQEDMLGEHADQIFIDVDMACSWADAIIWMGLHSWQGLDLMREMRSRYPNKAFFTELDDIFFKVPQGNIAADYYYPGSVYSSILLDQMNMSDAVICSTESLKSMLPHSRIYVSENTIDLALWRGRISPTRQGVTIGWVGGASHNKDLELAEKPLKEILEKYPHVTVKILHGCPPFLKNHDRILWTHNFYTIDRYPTWVSRHRFDIGIAPLRDNGFNRAKSNLRWLEYSAMGIPTVASPVSHFLRTIREGETGYFADTEKDWIEKLEYLVNEPARRENVGNNAMEEVRKHWNPRLQAEKVKAAVEDVLNAKPNAIDTGDADRGLDSRPVASGIH